jgi:hypothetical protein
MVMLPRLRSFIIITYHSSSFTSYFHHSSSHHPTHPKPLFPLPYLCRAHISASASFIAPENGELNALSVVVFDDGVIGIITIMIMMIINYHQCAE